MATSRKKQDEKNLKTLRELASLQQNKYCFDCNQRGPTYVNVTIGSFVCTKCSGMLRGLTPPHRVKSISMATFTSEEIDLLRNRGNEYCRKVWLGLYEGTPTVLSSDEQSVRDFMIEKYERRRFYLDPAKADVLSSRSVSSTNGSVSSMSSAEHKSVKINGNQMQSAHRTRPEVNKNNINNLLNSTSLNSNNSSNAISTSSVSFPVDFDKADIFNNMNGHRGSNSNLVNLNNNNTSNGTVQRPQQHQQQQQNGFANFDNNPVFCNTSTATTTSSNDFFSIFDLHYTETHGPLWNDVPLFPKCNVNRWSMPTASSFSTMNGWNTQQNGTSGLNGSNNLNGSLNKNLNGSLSGSLNSTMNGSSLNGTLNGSLNGGAANGPSVPVEDKYAALKDLDNEFKSQKNLDWNSTGSNGSLYSSPTPNGSVYSSPSPQSSLFGSPTQGQFMSAFANLENCSTSNVSNPFNSNNVNWGNGLNGMQQQSQGQPFANPFRDTSKMNGFSQQSFQPLFPMTGVGGMNGANPWTPNPFKVGATATGNSNPNNPFL